MTPHLTYNIVEARLYGKIEDLEIREFAGSGGRAMTKTKGAENWLWENNWEMTFVKKTKNNPGGPIPRGRYKMVIHESRVNWIRLIPLAGEHIWEAGMVWQFTVEGLEGVMVASFLKILM